MRVKSSLYVGKAKTINIACPTVTFDTRIHACSTSWERQGLEKQGVNRERRMEEEVRSGEEKSWRWGGPEVRHQRTHLSKVQIFSPNRVQAGCFWYWKTSTHTIWENWLKHLFKNKSAEHFHPLNPATHLNGLQRPAEEQERERSRWLFSTWPREVRRKGHLPGYVSVTSKKEERRDTWSESDKSVRQQIHTVRRKGAFTCQVLGWGW